MATWSAESIIDVVFVPLYFILLLVNLVNCAKYGMSRKEGYVLLVLVSCFKISGNIMTIVVYTGASHSVSVASWGLILSQLGFYPLLIATLTFIRKWIFTWESVDPNLRTYLNPIRVLNILTTVAFICALIGGVWSRPSESRIDVGYRLRRAGDILFIIAVAAILVAAIYMRSRSVVSEQRNDPTFIQVFVVLPIMFTRMIYATIQAFLSTPQNPGHNPWVYLALLLIPDLISDAIYTFCGVFLRRSTEATDTAKRIEDSAYTRTLPSTQVETRSDHPLQSFDEETPDYHQPASYQSARRQQNYQQNYQGQPQQPNYGRRLRIGRMRRGPLHMLFNAVMDRLK